MMTSGWKLVRITSHWDTAASFPRDFSPPIPRLPLKVAVVLDARPESRASSSSAIRGSGRSTLGTALRDMPREEAA